MKKLLLTVWLVGLAVLAQAQLYDPSAFDKKYDGLLKHPGVQIESAEAINLMYNYKFYEADKEFRWLRLRYPKHPMPYFLMGLAEWWKIVPNTDITDYDGPCLTYMDSTITMAEKMYEDSDNKLEPSFFLAAAYAFKGRLFSERKKWAKATIAGKNALKYFEKCKGNADFSPELLFGDGMYNYYAQWIPENYPILKPILMFFPKGNKANGIKELEKTANTAFYTRVEARYFLVQIYSMENQYDKAYDMSKYMYEQYPDNPFFERYFARSAFVTGRLAEAERASRDILAKVDRTQAGYEGVSGRTAAYILAYINHLFYKNLPEAKVNYQKSIDYAKQTNSTTSGYYLSSVLGLAKIATEARDFDLAQTYFQEVIDKAERKSSQYKEAKKALDDAKKLRREERRRRKG
ncbi:tetratricopeptide repeat protein [Spirosoma sp.]|uniref:tetratricopeptide repeat protein n=1 Tax=Spirosoma sp. TaxID=1899569 RepID=UPI002622DA99|nr:tetratricopeptide repeat protein [Spirosoma sp.]MCX6213055.1 tetratricopeptide repeat protein [Spirosoma sp.]